MIRHIRKRKCKHCKVFFDPDARNLGRQRYCSQPACRQASKAASQQRWRSKPENRDYFRGAEHVERVRQWRQAHAGYGRRKRSQRPETLQETLTPQAPEHQALASPLAHEALQETFFMQSTVFVGLIAHLTGLTLQDDIALTARRLQQLGHDILARSPHYSGGRLDAQTSPLAHATATRAQPVQLGGSAPGP